jgi:hypothetical protein
MIDNDKLKELRELTESFSEPGNKSFEDMDKFFETNSYLLNSCSRLVNESSENDGQEAELCYVLLRAISSLVIATTSPLIADTVRRTRALLGRMQPSLQKARIMFYLYCVDPIDRDREEAKTIIAHLQTTENMAAAKRLIKDFDMIAG